MFVIYIYIYIYIEREREREREREWRSQIFVIERADKHNLKEKLSNLSYNVYHKR
jgi:hypothetical protein